MREWYGAWEKVTKPSSSPVTTTLLLEDLSEKGHLPALDPDYDYYSWLFW